MLIAIQIKFAIELKYTVSGVTFDEDLVCAIEICIRPSVQELRRWVDLEVNIVFWRNRMSVKLYPPFDMNWVMSKYSLIQSNPCFVKKRLTLLLLMM